MKPCLTPDCPNKSKGSRSHFCIDCLKIKLSQGGRKGGESNGLRNINFDARITSLERKIDIQERQLKLLLKTKLTSN